VQAQTERLKAILNDGELVNGDWENTILLPILLYDYPAFQITKDAFLYNLPLFIFQPRVLRDKDVIANCYVT
jgi:hypothetical protein